MRFLLLELFDFLMALVLTLYIRTAYGMRDLLLIKLNSSQITGFYHLSFKAISQAVSGE